MRLRKWQRTLCIEKATSPNATAYREKHFEHIIGGSQQREVGRKCEEAQTKNQYSYKNGISTLVRIYVKIVYKTGEPFPLSLLFTLLNGLYGKKRLIFQPRYIYLYLNSLKMTLKNLTLS